MMFLGLCAVALVMVLVGGTLLSNYNEVGIFFLSVGTVIILLTAIFADEYKRESILIANKQGSYTYKYEKDSKPQIIYKAFEEKKNGKTTM